MLRKICQSRPIFISSRLHSPYYKQKNDFVKIIFLLKKILLYSGEIISHVK